MDDNQNNVLESRISALEKDFERNSNQHREFYDRFSKIDVKQGVIDNTLSTLVNTINDLRTDVKSLKDEPGKNLNAIKMCVVTAFISGVVGYLVSFAFR